MTTAPIKRYKSLGWRFKIEPYVDHHKGTDEVLHYVKSPRMREEALICCPYRSGPYDGRRSDVPWEDMSEDELLDWEAKAVACDLLSQSGWEEQNRRIAELAKQLRAKPKAKSFTVTVRLDWLTDFSYDP